MIIATVIGDREIIARLNAMPRNLQSGLARAITRLGLELQRKVQGEKLSGQVLHVRTGVGRSSINLKVDQSATAVTASVGTPLSYMRAHELGFHGTVSVRAHLRQITQVFGHPIAPTTQHVGAHSRRMNLPERSFLRSSLREMQTAIQSGVAEAVHQELHR